MWRRLRRAIESNQDESNQDESNQDESNQDGSSQSSYHSCYDID